MEESKESKEEILKKLSEEAIPKVSHSEKKPWRASVPWWFSVGHLQFEDLSRPLLEIHLAGKTYLFQQSLKKMPDKEGQKDYLSTMKLVRDEERNRLLCDFRGIIWMTYRKGITGIKKNLNIPKALHLDSDDGWGCALRSAQMLLANSILRHTFEGISYSLETLQKNPEIRMKYLKILSHFLDCDCGSDSAFSIGNIVEVGFNKHKMNPKNWYGPATMIQILADLNERYSPFSPLKILAFPEGVIYKDQVLKCETEGNWNPIIVLSAFRLGIDSIPAELRSAIFATFDLDLTVGMMGAQGNGALYFIGYQDNSLIFLDPHVVQPAVPHLSMLCKSSSTYHYFSPKTIMGKN